MLQRIKIRCWLRKQFQKRPVISLRIICWESLRKDGASAAVEGYAVGGKTGTAEKLPRGNGKYLVSFIGYAPQENPQVMVYVVIDEPNSAVQANSGYATQLASQIMTDIFPYLGVEKKDGASDTIETSAEETTTQTAQE